LVPSDADRRTHARDPTYRNHLHLQDFAGDSAITAAVAIWINSTEPNTRHQQRLHPSRL
jgi:hypothetical protein